MLRRFSINFALFSIFLDGLSVLSSLWLAAALRPFLNQFSFIEKISPPIVVPQGLYILFTLIWVVIYLTLSIYDGRKYLRAVDEFSMLSLAVLIAAVSSAGVLYFSYRQVSRALFLTFVLLAYVFCVLWRSLARSYFRLQKTSPARDRRVLIVGTGSLGVRVHAQMIEAHNPNLIPLGFVDHGPGLSNESPFFLGDSENIKEITRDLNISDVVIALPHSAYHQMGDIVQRLEDQPVQVWVALGFFDLALYKTSIEDFAGIPMLDLRASAIDEYQRMIKRAFDLIFGLTALVLALPLMAFAALLVFLGDGMPILFQQTRVGENGRLFNMLKFRTMVRNAEQLQGQVEKRDTDGKLLHKSKEDPRVTRAGKFLRRFSLDELPQFINVVRGDMSLVGPRPEMPYLVEKYQPWQRKRFAIPPGITGWWQVNGRSDKPMHFHTEDDLYYIANYSIWLDILILMRTIWVVFVGKGAY
jgi:exopolysaccharide biosynthesis polyprenyl glycosylphosphotransferase